MGWVDSAASEALVAAEEALLEVVALPDDGNKLNN